MMHIIIHSTNRLSYTFLMKGMELNTTGEGEHNMQNS